MRYGGDDNAFDSRQTLQGVDKQCTCETFHSTVMNMMMMMMMMTKYDDDIIEDDYYDDDSKQTES